MSDLLKIRLFEDLPQDAKDARNKLWPLVEKARKEGRILEALLPSLMIPGMTFSQVSLISRSTV